MARTDTPFSDALSARMAERGLAVRALARLCAGEGATDAKVETERRRLNKYLNEGKHPKPERTSALEQLLGLPEGELAALIPPRSRREAAGRPNRLEELAGKLADLLGAHAELEGRVALLESERKPRRASPTRRGQG